MTEITIPLVPAPEDPADEPCYRAAAKVYADGVSDCITEGIKNGTPPALIQECINGHYSNLLLALSQCDNN